MVGDYFFLDFFTRAGNFLYWVDFAHFMQSTEPSKPLDAKQARDWALDLKGMLAGRCGLLSLLGIARIHFGVELKEAVGSLLFRFQFSLRPHARGTGDEIRR